MQNPKFLVVLVLTKIGNMIGNPDENNAYETKR
jgi:hypothetical protein